MRNGSIYLLTNKLNGKKYVGQTIGKPERRWYIHIYTALSTVHKLSGRSESPLCRAIRKYGYENFEAKIIHTCAQSALDTAEQKFIKKHDCMTPSGYNLTSGGTGGRIVSSSTRKKHRKSMQGRFVSEETRQRQSKSQRIRFAENPMVWTDSARRKLSIRNMGKLPSAQCRAAARAARTGAPASAYSRQRSSETHKGIPKSPEHRAKISAAQLGVPRSSEAALLGWETRRRKAPRP